MTRITASLPAAVATARDREQPLDVARHQHRLLDARGDVRVEPPRLLVGGDRLLEEPAVAAGVDEPGEELGVVAVALRLAQQPHERRPRLAGLRLEVRVELVRQREPRVELERAAQGLPRRAPSLSGRAVDELADHAVAAAELRPGGSEARVELEAAAGRARAPAASPS